jgi:lipopolysaccharide export system ATP-binding protein
MANTLRSESLIKIYKKRKVVDNASVQVSKGEIVGLLGPNGAGKTTTFYMITGMIKPESGKVFLDDVEITTIPMYKRAKMGIGYLPQEASVFRRLSVEDNLLAVLETTRLNKEERIKKCEKLLDELSIQQIRKSKGFQLSGGERRRTEIARALATDPSFILLDEPFAGVDPIAVEDIMNIVANLKNRGIGVLITDHNVHETLSIVDKAYILIDGVIFKQGSANELASDEEVKKLYLGEKFRLDRYS